MFDRNGERGAVENCVWPWPGADAPFPLRSVLPAASSVAFRMPTRSPGTAVWSLIPQSLCPAFLYAAGNAWPCPRLPEGNVESRVENTDFQGGL